ncbi:type II secretion system protein [Nocardioides daeguensis]|uniref:Type II secretion system protein n=2 Tax=Nocardioides daeguensis TaxID=908359 RepID=A0ABP6VED9_9ACTN|nr:type II secretion system protein [Nocardioides daeguensis]MBV6728827.1 type II secretion system protein [Nocardioides daeguensis]MCR1773348.1 type II secretion system protein [Nocardioides daeguensis]
MDLLLVALLLAGALLLVVPAQPRLRDAGPVSRSGRRWRVVLAATAAASVALLARGSVPGMVLPLVGLAVASAVVRSLAARRRDRAAAQVRRRVVDLCDGLRAELSAGQTAAGALDRAATEWSFVAPAARAALTGGDVVAALRSLATVPGGEALRVVAGAWQVAHRTGHGLADTLGRVAADLRAAERTRRVVGGELASARATARLLAALPVLALLMGSGAGADPLRFLLGHPAGLACLVGGLATGYAGLVWIEALARDVERRG